MTQTLSQEELRAKVRDLVYRLKYRPTKSAYTPTIDDIMKAIDKYAASQFKALLDEVEKTVIGEYWPTHCAKGFGNCDQCRNREILNGQIYEQTTALNSLKEKV